MSWRNPITWKKILSAIGILMLVISVGVGTAILANATIWDGVGRGLKWAIALAAVLGLADRFIDRQNHPSATPTQNSEDRRSGDSAKKDEASEVLLNWRAKNRPLSKEDLRDLGHKGPLAVYASSQALNQFEELSKYNRKKIEREIKSLRQGGVNDVARETRNSQVWFRNVLRQFDLRFSIVERKLKNAEELPGVSNREAETEVGIYFTSILERSDIS